MMNETTVVRNPYAKKKPVNTAISHTGISASIAPWNPKISTAVNSDETASNDVVSTMCSSIPRLESLAHRQNLVPPQSSMKILDTGTMDHIPSVEKSDNAHLAATTPEIDFVARQTKALPPNSARGNIPIWQRLPSQSITFTSAEILTIPEVSERFQTHSVVQVPSHGDAIENKSIRVTGVVWHRYVHSDASVSLVLRDPITPLSPTTPSRPTSILKRPRTATSIQPSDPETPAIATTEPSLTTASLVCSTQATTVPVATGTSAPAFTAAATKTPSATARLTVSSAAVNRSLSSSLSSILQNNKKKTFLYKKPGSGRRLSFATSGIKPPASLGTSTAAGSLLAKRPLQRGHVAQDPLDALVQAISGRVPCVWVVVIPSNQHLAASTATNCVVNDLAMVMGEVMALNVTRNSTTSNTTSGMDTIQHKDCVAVTQVLQKLSSLRGHDENHHHRMYSLQARILRNVNGTDMRLFTDALLARRLFLQNRTQQKPESSAS